MKLQYTENLQREVDDFSRPFNYKIEYEREVLKNNRLQEQLSEQKNIINDLNDKIRAEQLKNKSSWGDSWRK